MEHSEKIIFLNVVFTINIYIIMSAYIMSTHVNIKKESFILNYTIKCK